MKSEELPHFFVLTLLLFSFSGCSYKDNATIAITSEVPDYKCKRKLQIDTASQKILLIGDSMADGLDVFLSKYAEYNHHEYRKLSICSSTILFWGNSDTLRKTVNRYKPTYLIISLGSNELFNTYLDHYPTYIQSIEKQASDIEFVWIGPPNWKKDAGLNDTIEHQIGKERYFASKNLTLERGEDKIHPTLKGFSQWTDSVAKWLMTGCAHKIVFKPYI